MKKLLFYIALLPTLLLAQNTDNCIPDNLYKVTTKSGMKMREGPNQNHKVVLYVPSQEYLLVCDELSTPATFENKTGNWRRVKYKNFYGYLFDGFISEAENNLILIDSSWTVMERSKAESYTDSIKQVSDAKALAILRQDSIDLYDAEMLKAPQDEYVFLTETYNYCGDINTLDPGIRWYGIYFDEEQNVYKNRKVELQIIRSKYALGSGLEFDIKSENGVPPHFMIGTTSKLDLDLRIEYDVNFYDSKTKELFPGQKINFYAKEAVNDVYNFTMYATGNVSDVGRCPELDNYQLRLTGEMNDKLLVQNLTTDISYMGDCGMPSIYWFGDFNSDGYPDFILAGKGKEQTTFTLFVSDTRKNGVLVRKASEWSYRKCD